MKLYWRYKKDGKWSWKPAKFDVDLSNWTVKKRRWTIHLEVPEEEE